MADLIPLSHVALRGSPGRAVARRGGGELLSHERFAVDVGRWHAAFAARPGDSVALYFDDGYDFAAALFGAWHAGKLPVLLGDAQPATLDRLLPEVDARAGNLPGACVPTEHATPPTAPLDLRQARTVIYTSGSSGQPVAIHKRLAQLDAELQHLEAVFGPRLGAADEAVIHGTVSHQHIYGLLFLVLWPLAAGRPVAVDRLAYPEQMALQLGGLASVLVSSPAHLRRLPESVDWSPARAALRAIFSSGGPLPPESSQQAHALLGQSPIEVYGSSETGGVAWRQRAHDGDAWRPLPGVQWRLREDTLCVQSNHLEDDAWFETSDRAKALDDGRFLLQGRADRIAKIEEKRVSLIAMEEALVATGLVLEARALLVGRDADSRLTVVAVPSAQGWEQLAAGGKRALNDQLRAHLLRGFERVVLPRRFRYLRELPVNAQGKSTEALLSALFEPELPAARQIESHPTRATFELDVVPQLRVFDGHFSGAPVLPGVVQIDWAIQFARRAFAVPEHFQQAEQLKFQRAVLPPIPLQLALDWKAETGQLEFRFSSEQGVHSSGRLVFGAAHV